MQKLAVRKAQLLLTALKFAPLTISHYYSGLVLAFLANLSCFLDSDFCCLRLEYSDFLSTLCIDNQSSLQVYVRAWGERGPPRHHFGKFGTSSN